MHMIGTNARYAATLAGMSTSDTFWMGYNDINNESTWEWIDGTTIGNSYTNWNTGEPNNSGGSQDCGRVYYDGM